MATSFEKSDPDGLEPPGASRLEADPAVSTTSTNKHLTRLVRFSILQARRSSSQKGNGNVTPSKDGSMPLSPKAGESVTSPSSAANGGMANKTTNTPTSSNVSSKKPPRMSPTKNAFSFGNFPSNKERPSTEVQYRDEYHDAPGQVRGNGGIGSVVDVPADPPIIEDLGLSASLTLSAGDGDGDRSDFSNGSIGDEEDDDEGDHEDMDLLLAPDSGSAGIMTNQSSSNEQYGSAEMYSSSGNYDDHSSDISSSSSDSIMRRVEQEIANARRASNDAQARLAYFTQKQKELAPVMTDSYSFDFENHLETSGDDPDQLAPQLSQQQQRQNNSGMGYTGHPQRHHEDNFNKAMGVIGKEFGNNPGDVEEKVDIEVVLAPSQNQNQNTKNQPPHNRKPNIPSPRRSPANRQSPGRTPPPAPKFGGYKTPSPRQQYRSEDSIDIDEAVIQAVFSEKSIESLPIRESFQQDVFSEPSMDSLPTQPPGSYSFQDNNYNMDSPSYVVSPSGSHQKKPNMLPLVSGTVGSPQQRHMQTALSVEVTSPLSTGSVASPTDSDFRASPGRRSSKLPSTPRDPGTPSYRERLENKLKILGSRYPVTSPVKSNTTPNSKRENVPVAYKGPGDEAVPRKSDSDDKASPPPKKEDDDEPSAPSIPGVESAYGESYDGLESRIKHLLARTLHPMPPPTPAEAQKQTGEQEAVYQSSPSAELKAIRKLLEQGVAAAAAAEERKRDQEENATPVADTNAEVESVVEAKKTKKAEEYATPVADTNAEVESVVEAKKTKKAEDLSFPHLDETAEESQEVTTSGTVDKDEDQDDDQGCLSKANTSESQTPEDDEGIRLHPRSTGSVPAVLKASSEKKESEPSVTCSTSEEILEQLDSLSQSSAFKSKSRTTSSNGKGASGSASPQSIPEGSKENVDDPRKRKTKGTPEKTETVSGSTGATDGKETSPETDNGHKNEEGTTIASKSSTEAVSGDANIEEGDHDDTDNSYIGSVVSKQVRNAVESDDHDQSTPRPAVKHDQTREESREKVHRHAAERNDDIPEARTKKEGHNVLPIKKNESRSKTPPTQQDDGTTASKKTPSVLNAALCRPSPSEGSRDRKSNEQKKQQKPQKHRVPEAEEEKSQSTNAAVNASPSQASENSSQVFGPTEPTAEERSKVSRQSVGTAEDPGSAEVRDQRSEDTTSASPSSSSKQNTELELQGNPPKSAPNSRETSQDLSGDKTMPASVVDPSQKSEKEELPPKPSANDVAPTTANQIPPRKTVSLQEPVVSKVRSDISQPRTPRQDRKIRFRDPYPTPKPCRRPRSNEEIQRDHSCQPSKADKKTKWKEPKGDLKRLLVAALDSSLSRRSNACGALKVISKVEKNKMILVRTTGFLEALVFVATDDISSNEPDAKEDARARAISCIYNVSHVKDNRLLVCTHPGLLECLVQTINEDHGEARTEACGVLAQLAKNSMCREVMVGVEELLSTLASVLKGTIDPQEKMIDDILSQDITEDIPSSYSEMSSVLSEEHIPFPKSSGKNSKKADRVRPNCSIRKQKSEMHDQYYELAKLSSCAALIHLSKQCSILDHFCSNTFLLESIIEVAGDSESKLHGKCLEMLCNVSRLPGNTTAMTRFPGMVETLLGACSSANGQDRVWALRTLQNMTSDAASKSTLATSTLLTLLINCVTSRNTDEQHAAMATLLNLSTDPSAVVPITSTKNVLATLVYLAHNAESTSEIRMMACNALATVGLWLQTVSGFGSIPEETRRVLLPSHKTTGWEIWD